MLNSIVKLKSIVIKRRNPTTGTVHIVREQYRYRLVKGQYGYRNIMYCGVQDNIKTSFFPVTNDDPTCKTCIKSFVAEARETMHRAELVCFKDSVKEHKTDGAHTRYVLATIGGGNQEYHPIANETSIFNESTAFVNLQDAIDERDEMADSDGIIIVKEIREILNV